MDISLSAKKAYDAYKKIAAKDFLHVTTTQLTVAYNVLCRMRRDEEYKAAIYALGGEGEPLDSLLEKYFLGYNNLHGLDITEILTVFDDPDQAEGSYFIVTTESKGTECNPVALKCGEVCHVKAVHTSRASGEALKVARLHYAVSYDGMEGFEGVLEDADTVELDLTLPHPGGLRVKVMAEDKNRKEILGSETAYIGLLYDIDSIKPTHKAPDDLYDFWRGEIKRLMDVDPLSTTPDGYEGRVTYEYSMPEKNAFSIKKLDAEYLALMRERGLPAPEDEKLSEFDVYELYLKSPGPCPSTAYVSIPKRWTDGEYPMHIVFDGYSAHTPAPILSAGKISIHCTHHGYELCKPDKDYYNHLNGQGILGAYGRGNGKINSDFADIHDCYLLYMLLRNLQMIRFCADERTASVIPGLRESFSGEVLISGGSMGGYQTVSVGGLCELLGEVQSGFKVKKLMPSIPAFCNIAGPLEGRIRTRLHSYEEGCDYFDAAILASFVRADLHIPRVGLGDETCPHTGIAAMVNNIPDGYRKDVNYLQNSSHGYVMDPELQKWYPVIKEEKNEKA